MFYEPQFFPFLATVEEHYEEIRDELEELTQSDFETYREFEAWKVFIFRKGFDPDRIEHFPENCARCPKTTAVLDSIPGVTSAAFSRLLPGTHLWPHRCKNTRLRCHLGLTIVDDCAIKVGGMVRQWQEGKSLLFNANYLHEAWNRNQLPRSVLLFDIDPETLPEPPEVHAIPKSSMESMAGLWLKVRYRTRKNWLGLRQAISQKKPTVNSD